MRQHLTGLAHPPLNEGNDNFPVPESDIQTVQTTTRLRTTDIFTGFLHCSKADEIVGLAAKLAATVSVDLCRFPADRCCLTLPPACSWPRVPAHARGPALSA